MEVSSLVVHVSTSCGLSGETRRMDCLRLLQEVPLPPGRLPSPPSSPLTRHCLVRSSRRHSTIYEVMSLTGHVHMQPELSFQYSHGRCMSASIVSTS